MFVELMTIEENAYSGFSHQVVFTYADLAALPAGLTGTLTLTGLTKDQDIILRGALVVDTQFTFSDAMTGCTASVGDSINGTTSILAAQQIQSAATRVAAAVALAFSAVGNLTITLTGTGGTNLNNATAGQVRILISKNSLAKEKIY